MITNSQVVGQNLETSETRKDKVEQKTLGEYLVVVGTYKNEMKALLYFNELCNDDVNAYFFHDRATGNYYVHVGRYYFEEDAKAVLRLNLYPKLRKKIRKVKSYPQE